MKLGLITDIHEDVEALQQALAFFQGDAVDQIVLIGDIFKTGEQIDETCRLLQEANVIGVWGNHDFGLCVDARNSGSDDFGRFAASYLATLQPHLEFEGCFFQHVEPWLDGNRIEDLWYFEGPPTTEEKRQRIFAQTSHRLMFAGHFHKWVLATPKANLEWNGESPCNLHAPQRYFVVIRALCEGGFATFDTASCELRPFQL